MEKQLYTVRSNRGRSRIWLEGKRLMDAGFTRDTQFWVVPNSKAVTLVLTTTETETPNKVRKVSGKGDRPIVDMVGAVVEPFTAGDDVEITYTPGRITIKLA